MGRSQETSSKSSYIFQSIIIALLKMWSKKTFSNSSLEVIEEQTRVENVRKFEHRETKLERISKVVRVISFRCAKVGKK